MPIRLARVGDEAGIARLHVHSWQSTYRGIVPDDVLCNLNEEERRQQWADALLDIRKTPGKKVIFVAVEDDEIVGFVCGGKARKEKLANPDAFDSELYAIYVESTAQGKGIGADLFQSLKDWLVKHNFNNMFLWAFADNPFLHFYPRMGGVLTPEEYTNESLGVPLKIISYAWYDLDVS